MASRSRCCSAPRARRTWNACSWVIRQSCNRFWKRPGADFEREAEFPMKPSGKKSKRRMPPKSRGEVVQERMAEKGDDTMRHLEISQRSRKTDNYLHANPYGLVTQPEHWRFSSANYWLQGSG